MAKFELGERVELRKESTGYYPDGELWGHATVLKITPTGRITVGDAKRINDLPGSLSCRTFTSDGLPYPAGYGRPRLQKSVVSA